MEGHNSFEQRLAEGRTVARRKFMKKSVSHYAQGFSFCCKRLVSHDSCSGLDFQEASKAEQHKRDFLMFFGNESRSRVWKADRDAVLCPKSSARRHGL